MLSVSTAMVEYFVLLQAFTGRECMEKSGILIGQVPFISTPHPALCGAA